MGDTTGGASFIHFDKVEWAREDKGGAIRELIEAGQASGARRKRMVTGQNGFYMNHNEMPPGFTVPVHTHSHDELIVVLEGGCTLLEGGPSLSANDTMVIRANHPYGFTCGPEGMRFLTVRNGEAAVVLLSSRSTDERA